MSIEADISRIEHELDRIASAKSDFLDRTADAIAQLVRDLRNVGRVDVAALCGYMSDGLSDATHDTECQMRRERDDLACRVRETA